MIKFVIYMLIGILIGLCNGVIFILGRYYTVPYLISKPNSLITIVSFGTAVEVSVILCSLNILY